MEEIIRSPFEKYIKTNISSLKHIVSIPEIQRVINQKRVNDIFQNIFESYKKGKEFLSPNTLIFAEHNNIKYLIDGQHRFLAYLKLFDEYKYDTELVINVISINDKSELLPLFNLINDTVPVACVPDNVSRKTCNEVVKYFMEKYPNIFSYSRNGRTQRPFVHQTKFEEEVNRLLEFYPDNLINKLEEINNELKSYNVFQFKRTKSDTQEKISKLRNKAINKGGLLFGMFQDFSCFDKLKIINNNTIFKRRDKVPIPLRDKVWRMYNGEKDKSTCMFCSKIIDKKSCHMAHNLAHSKGGDISIDNLYPCCSECNLSMDTKTFEEFKQDN